MKVKEKKKLQGLMVVADDWKLNQLIYKMALERVGRV